MSDDPKDPGWPEEAGAIDDLPREMQPPAALEDRVTRRLALRGLLAAGGRPGARHTGGGGLGLRWGGLAAAAALLSLATGFLVGRASSHAPATGAAAAVPSQYALLLYETEGYDAPVGAEGLVRYREYSRWVAEARRRGQFVTGEDLAVEHGWVMAPGPERPLLRPGTATDSPAALSGIFLITASEPEQALALAESLPHLRHGGQVVVQPVLPTDVPPEP